MNKPTADKAAVDEAAVHKTTVDKATTGKAAVRKSRVSAGMAYAARMKPARASSTETYSAPVEAAYSSASVEAAPSTKATPPGGGSTGQDGEQSTVGVRWRDGQWSRMFLYGQVCPSPCPL
jgi:hypothetical protein